MLKIDNDGISVARATVTANEGDAADYLTMGYWMHIAGNLTEFSFTGVEIGTFVDGPELSLTSPASLPNQGTASYYGPAGGAYGVQHGAGEAGTPGPTEIGEFASTVELTADFAGGTIGGCVGCRDGVALFGVLHDADTGEESDVLLEDSGYRLHLGSISLDSNGTFRGEDVRLEHAATSITRHDGRVGRPVLEYMPDSAGDPRLVAGTSGAEATGADESEAVFPRLLHRHQGIDVCSGAAPFERSHFHSLTGTVIDINGARLGSRGGGPALNTGPPVADQP